MNKHLTAVKTILEKKKAAVAEKLKQASLTTEQKTALDEVMSQINEAISELEAAGEAATSDQLGSIFSKAVETLTAISDQSTAEIKTEVAAMMSKLQAKMEKTTKAKKFSARMSLKKMRAPEGKYIPYSAGVDVTAWTPEAEIEQVEVFHPLFGLAAGFTVGTTAKTSVKIRKLSDSGQAAVVANHEVKPEIEFVGAQSTANVATIAGVVKGIADEDLEDNSDLETEITNEALVNLAEAENISAKALLDFAPQAFANAAYGTKSYVDEKTALSAIIDQVRQALGNRQSQIVLAMNSSQWAKLNDLRNANGTPIDIASAIGDVQRVIDNTIPTDTVYCWAKKYVNLKIYKGAMAEWYKGVKTVLTEGVITAVYSEWQLDESSLRVRERALMYVSDTSTVVKTTLSGVIEALLAPEVEG